MNRSDEIDYIVAAARNVCPELAHLSDTALLATLKDSANSGTLQRILVQAYTHAPRDVRRRIKKRSGIGDAGDREMERWASIGRAAATLQRYADDEDKL